MLNSLYKDAIKNREGIISRLNNPDEEKIKEIAKKTWIEYEPKIEECDIAGIDSSYNLGKFQGAELWAADAVAIKKNEVVVSEDHAHGIKTNDVQPEIKASLMEITVCDEAKNKVELVLMDGSITSHFDRRQGIGIGKNLKEALKKKNVVFIAKTSNTLGRFKELGASLGEMYYYNYTTKSKGFSEIFENRDYGSGKIVSHVFARLNESVPLIKIELFGPDHTTDEIKDIINKINKQCIRGYPYSLKLAHNRCKISGSDIDRLVRLFGMSNMIGSREVLG